MQIVSHEGGDPAAVSFDAVAAGRARGCDVVIADTAGVIALAGVMGGLETEVTATTKTILLESASFDFVSVRRTARQFNLFSEASTRFSKGVHPEVAKTAALRAAVADADGPTSLRSVLAPLAVRRYRPPVPAGGPAPWTDCDTPAELARARAQQPG